MKPGKHYIGVGIGLLIQNEKGEVLFGKRGPMSKNEKLHWSLPGGAVEYGDTLEDTVRREAREELDVDVEIIAQTGAIDHFIPKDGQHWVAIEFLCRIKPGQTPKIMEPEKCVELKWFSLGNLPEPLATSARPAIEAYRKYLVILGKK